MRKSIKQYWGMLQMWMQKHIYEMLANSNDLNAWKHSICQKAYGHCFEKTLRLHYPAKGRFYFSLKMSSIGFSFKFSLVIIVNIWTMHKGPNFNDVATRSKANDLKQCRCCSKFYSNLPLKQLFMFYFEWILICRILLSGTVSLEKSMNFLGSVYSTDSLNLHCSLTMEYEQL